MFETKIIQGVQYMIYKTVLHSACESGNLDTVKYILSLNKIDINCECNNIINFVCI